MVKDKALALIAEEYLKTWEKHDLTDMGRHLHPDLHFKEPLSEIAGLQSFLEFAERNLKFVKEVRIVSKFEFYNEVVLIYDFVFKDPIGSQKTAAHFTFDSDRVRNIELFYDPRHLERMMSSTQNERI